MKTGAFFLSFTLVGLLMIVQVCNPPSIEAPALSGTAPKGIKPALVNPAIDMQGYLDVSEEAAAYRETHRLTEAEFIVMSRQPGTLILDARSSQKFDELHIKGAVNLSFPDITVESLRQTIPDFTTRVLIYCNNNFEGALEPFPMKMATASLNISTYIALYNYGYRNVYELGPLLDVQTSNLEFEGTWLGE